MRAQQGPCLTINKCFIERLLCAKSRAEGWATAVSRESWTPLVHLVQTQGQE